MSISWIKWWPIIHLKDWILHHNNYTLTPAMDFTTRTELPFVCYDDVYNQMWNPQCTCTCFDCSNVFRFHCWNNGTLSWSQFPYTSLTNWKHIIMSFGILGSYLHDLVENHMKVIVWRHTNVYPFVGRWVRSCINQCQAINA